MDNLIQCIDKLGKVIDFLRTSELAARALQDTPGESIGAVLNEACEHVNDVIATLELIEKGEKDAANG